MEQKNTYYEVLNLPRDASADEIRRAYRQLVRELHPDAKPNSSDSTDRFIAVQEAFEVLNHAERRDNYDKTLPPEIQVRGFTPLKGTPVSILGTEGRSLLWEAGGSGFRIQIPEDLRGDVPSRYAVAFKVLQDLR